MGEILQRTLANKLRFEEESKHTRNPAPHVGFILKILLAENGRQPFLVV
jgi:hypothetical protein